VTLCWGWSPAGLEGLDLVRQVATGHSRFTWTDGVQLPPLKAH